MIKTIIEPFKIKSVEPFDGSMVVSYAKKTETLSLVVCEKLLVA